MRTVAASALEIGQRVDALVQLVVSGSPLDLAPDALAGVAEEDWPALAEAFAHRAWADDHRPITDRAQRVHDWLRGLRERP